MTRCSWLVICALALGCNPETDDTDAPDPADDNFGVVEDRGEEACNNLEPTRCLMPFPSDIYRDTSGERPAIRFPSAAMPVSADGEPMSVESFAKADGFGVASPILITYPDATLAGLVPVFDPAASLLDDARTILLDADTGERIPHWVETDYLVRNDLPVFTIRPAVPLPRSHRVVVALRGWVDAEGEVLPPPVPFRALRDGTASTWRGLHAQRAHFESSIFPALEDAGFARDELQMAWDFTVASSDNAIADLSTARDRMLSVFGDGGPDYRIDTIELDPDAELAAVIDGKVFVPSFVLPPDELGIRLFRRDADGLPLADGEEEVSFRLMLPKSMNDSDEPMPVMQYGHGFLGGIPESNGSWLRSLANENRFAVLAAAMQGMCNRDCDRNMLDVWLGTLSTDGGRFPDLADEAMQGVLNHIAMQRMMKTSFQLEDDPLIRPDEHNVIDPEQVWYYGNSQGGSMGTVIMGATTEVERGVLGIPGASYPFLLHRSTVFQGYAILIQALYPDPAAVPTFLGLLGTGWDRMDPLTWAPHIMLDPPEGTPPKHVMLHIAKEDAQVHTQVSFLLGRAVGASQPLPAVREVWGVDHVSFPYTGSSIVEFDFGVPDDVDSLTPPPDACDTHGTLRKVPEGREQKIHFLRTGETIDTCDGDCTFPDWNPCPDAD